MKLALIRQQYNPFGGAERFVTRALEALRRRDVDVTLLTRRWVDVAGFRAEILNPRFRSRTQRDRGFRQAVERYLAQHPFDLVQSHERIPGCDIFRAGDGVHAAWLEEKLHGASWFARLWTWLSPYHRYVLRTERELFSHPRLKAVICNSKLVQRQIHERFGLPYERLPLIYNGIDLAAFNPQSAGQRREALRAELGIPADAPVLLYVGSGFYRKGVPLLLALMPQLLPSLHLVVVGHDKHLRRLRQQLGQHPAGTRIHLTGGVNDVLPFYGLADALALPTRYDPFPNVAVEALACGLPVITTPQCGAAELIQSGHNGFVAAYDDPAAWRMAIEAALDPARNPACRLAARQTAETLDIQVMTGQLMALYESLIPKNPI